jgi:hypothetical protein
MYLSNSRYQEATSQGDKAAVAIGVRKGTMLPDTIFTPYITSVGDTFDSLAYGIFGDPLRWWEIADINPEIAFPGEIPAGTILRVPRS